MERKLRKHQSTLVVAGTGVILFGLWSIIKTIVFLAASMEELLAYSVELGLTDNVILWIVLGMICVILGTDLLARLYIGLCAMSEGKGRKKQSLYLVLASVLLVSSVAAFPGNFFTAQSLMDFSLDTFIAMVLEFTSLYAMGDLIFSGVRVKQLHRQLEK